MEQIPSGENKKPEQEQGGFHLDLSGTTPHERKEIFLRLLGLSERATEADMMELINKEHKEFQLEEFKKKEGPVGEESGGKAPAPKPSPNPDSGKEGWPPSGFGEDDGRKYESD